MLALLLFLFLLRLCCHCHFYAWHNSAMACSSSVGLSGGHLKTTARRQTQHPPTCRCVLTSKRRMHVRADKDSTRPPAGLYSPVGDVCTYPPTKATPAHLPVCTHQQARSVHMRRRRQHPPTCRSVFTSKRGLCARADEGNTRPPAGVYSTAGEGGQGSPVPTKAAPAHLPVCTHQRDGARCIPMCGCTSTRASPSTPATPSQNWPHALPNRAVCGLLFGKG